MAKREQTESESEPIVDTEKLAHETWAERKDLARDWRYAAARSRGRWIVGFEVTEEEFDKAVADAAAVTLR